MSTRRTDEETKDRVATGAVDVGAVDIGAAHVRSDVTERGMTQTALIRHACAMEALASTTVRLASGVSRAELVETTALAAKRLSGARWAHAAVDAGDGVAFASSGVGGAPATLPLGADPPWPGETIVVNGATDDGNALAGLVRIGLLSARDGAGGSITAVPLRGADGAAVGVLAIADPSPVAFDSTTRSMIEALASQAATALDRLGLRERLERSERRFRETVESAASGIALCTADGELRFVNDRACALLGRDRDALLGACLDDLLDPADRAHARQGLRSVRSGRSGAARHAELELRALCAQGARRWIHLAASSMERTVADEPLLVLVIEDIEDRKCREAALTRSAEESRQRAHQLAELDERRSELLAILGHELRNPLAALDAALHVLHDAEPGTDDDERARAITRRQVAQLRGLIDDLLDVTRMASGHVPLDLAPCDLRDVAKRAIESIDHRIRERGHELLLSLGEEPLVVAGDAARLEQVLVNLLGNAATYTPRGGHLGLDLARKGGMAVVAVSDDGIGLEIDHVERVFEPFSQVRSTGPREGLGIGLSIVRQLIELHGGRVSAYSEGRGRGSTFELSLPLRDDGPGDEGPAGSDLPRPPQPPQPPRPRTSGLAPEGVSERSSAPVLLVDDDPDVAWGLARVLEAAGHEVDVCALGRDALDSFRPERHRCVVLDLGLPDMSGLEVGRRLRQRSGAEAVSMVAITGYGDAGLATQTLAGGFDAHLVKPIDPERLLEALCEAGRKRAAPPSDDERRA